MANNTSTSPHPLLLLLLLTQQQLNPKTQGPKPAERLAKGEAPGAKYDYEEKVDFAVFPSLQGGPHNHQIGALAVALKHAATPEFAAYQRQVVANCRALAARLLKHGYSLVTGGTDNHLILWDLRPLGVSGGKMERACELCHVTLNKNSVLGDVSAFTPGGVRIGTPAMTSRGLVEADWERVADFLHEIAQICVDVQAKSGAKLLKDFAAALERDERIAGLRARVEAFAGAFPMPGFAVDDLAPPPAVAQQ